MKSFVRTCYSETLLAAAPGEGEADAEKQADSSFVIEDGVGVAGTEQKVEEQKFHGGLGIKFKFPGDPKKCAFIQLSLIEGGAND